MSARQSIAPAKLSSQIDSMQQRSSPRPRRRCLAWAHGQASDPLDARTDLAAVAVLHASAGLAIRVRPHLRLRIDLGTDVLLPHLAVRVAGDEVARLGSPLIRGALGLEWQWPR